jgi:type III secretory pathway component EscR
MAPYTLEDHTKLEIHQQQISLLFPEAKKGVQAKLSEAFTVGMVLFLSLVAIAIVDDRRSRVVPKL